LRVPLRVKGWLRAGVVVVVVMVMVVGVRVPTVRLIRGVRGAVGIAPEDCWSLVFGPGRTRCG